MATNAVSPASAAVELKIPAGGQERQEWRMTGKLPEEKEEVQTEAESSTAQDAQAESSTAAAEEVETQPEEQVARPEKKRRGAEARIIELLEENKRLREQVGTPKETKAEPSPAPKATEPLKKPSINDFQTMGEYEDALDKYYRDFARSEALQAVQEAEFKRDLNAKVQDATSRYGDWKEAAKPIVGKLTDGSIDKSVLDAIDDSPYFADVLYALGKAEDGGADFLAKAKSNPRQAIKLVGAMEQLIHEELTADSRKSQSRDDKGKFATDKKISKAPPPPTELSGTSGTPPDEVASAAARGDFRAFMAAANRRDVASRKG